MNTVKGYRVAVVGATGAVGKEMLNILVERKFPFTKLHAVASSRSAGKQIKLGNLSITVEDLKLFDFSQVDLALFSAGGSISKEFAPLAASSGCIVIDNTSYFRYEDDIPLIVPEVNSEELINYKKRGIIANPNCSTIQMLLAVKPIYDAVGIKRINVATYQAVSGSGQSAINELNQQTQDISLNRPVVSAVYPVQIAHNVIPHIDVFMENGYTKEEMKMVWETQKILSDSNILVNPTAVRVPVFYGHSEAINIETNKEVDIKTVYELLNNFPGVRVIDKRESGGYPTPAIHAEGQDWVSIGRVRKDISHPCALNLWVVADNLRKGAALNSVQISENLINYI